MLSNKAAPTIKGDQIGSWKLGETLGFGSTGKVQLAYNKNLNKHAAIKIISKAIFKSQALTDNRSNSGTSSKESYFAQSSTPDSLPYGIEREIIIMKLLNHPNVLRLYDVWETNSNLYMVLEYAEKGELFNLLVERGPLPENEAIRFFRQIIIGISYCHALGIVHRDLKPENLLLDNKYNIKIADFGMAALETEDKLLETSCGSPHYAAPEIVSGIPYHGFASDVWSCGVILFALLTGRLPFDEEDGNIRNLLLKVQSGQFEMPDTDEISNEAQDLISKILVVDPRKRISARDILKHPLLQKYPSIKDSKSIRNLPREDTYLHPLADTNSIVDEGILQNLIVLWHGRDGNEIKSKLNEPGANAEKTLYALLYRFKMDAEQENLKNEHIRKRQSVTPPDNINNQNLQTNSNFTNRSPNKNVSTPQRRKNRASMISVGSSHKRPISYIKVSSGTSLSSVNLVASSSSNRGKNPVKRLSKMSASNNESPTPASRNRRLSKIKSDRHSIVMNNNSNSKSQNKNGKKTPRNSKRISMLPNMKRGSITTKLLATYTKLSEDDDWEYIEQETKRTSSDFATLIDEIFEHEKYEQLRKEKEELARKVREAKEREEAEKKRKEEEERLRRLELEAQEKAKADQKRQMEEEIGNLKKELENLRAQENNTDFRSVSEPLNSKEKNTEDNNEFNIDDVLRQRNFSLQTRPVSRLDPGLFFEPSEPSSSVGNNTYLNRRVPFGQDDINEKLKTEKMILETIRRSKFLGSTFDINRELRTASSKLQYPPTVQPPVLPSTRTALVDIKENEPLPDNAIATAPLRSYDEQKEVRKISDIKIPQFTRKSRHFSESNKRLSVLSLYSTKQSYTNLADIVKKDDYDVQPINKGKNYGYLIDNKEDSEFNFESIIGEENNKESVDNKLYEVDELPEPTEKKKTLKLNLADRYNQIEETSISEPEKEPGKVKLPVLPPLNSKNAGLGIYQEIEDVKKIDVGETEANNDLENEIATSPNSNNERIKEKPKEENIRNATKQFPKESISLDKQDKNEKINIPKQRGLEMTKEKPRQDSQTATNFFRKLSGGISPTDNIKSSKNNGLAILNTTVSPDQLYQGLFNLLRGWAMYGIKGLKGNSETRVITGKLSSDNILSLRSTVFEISVTGNGKHSQIQIKKRSGSSKAVRRLIGEIENILTKEGVLQK